MATIKGYFDICIGSSSSEASPETKYEYEVLMKRQATLQNLKDLDSDIISWVRKVVDCPEQDMFKLLGTLPNHPFLNFIKFTMIDFLLNCMRTTRYNGNDERTAYCEIFIPIFKAFGNTTQKLEYTW